jgi:peptide chain release factor subunit 1
MTDEITECDAVELWRMKKLIKTLEQARGNGTSMITLIVPPKDQISRVSKMLSDEIGTATNIKSRVNRLSVLSAIASAQQKLKLYSRVPDNGLVIYSGQVITPEGNEKKMSIDFEPFKPINTSRYMCDSRFHTEPLQELLQEDKTYGFIIMDGHGTLYGTLCGNTRAVLHKISVDLPKKHGRGGQSSLRFERIRNEKRANYLRKVAEMCTQLFISNDRPNVAGLILAGSAEFKAKLSTSDLFDPRLSAIVLKLLDVQYGGENGFNQAIELATDILNNVKFIAEKKLLSEYFTNIAMETNKYCFGEKDTLTALEMGTVEVLIVWENLPIVRYELHDPISGEDTIVNGMSAPSELEIKDSIPLVEWLATNYKKFGARLEFITDQSQEGNQFVRGFGGIGGLLRYEVNFASLEPDSECWVSDDGEDFI